jgi:hypothetical protein
MSALFMLLEKHNIVILANHMLYDWEDLAGKPACAEGFGDGAREPG